MGAVVRTPKPSTPWPRLSSTILAAQMSILAWDRWDWVGSSLYDCPFLSWLPSDPSFSDSFSVFSLLSLPGPLCSFPYALSFPWHHLCTQKVCLSLD